MASLTLKNVYKVYDNDVTAVNDFNINIEDEEFIVFVGPSGCGKSTTLRMIAGLEEISKGELYIDGEIMNDVAPKDRNIAMVFQNYALYPHMTVRENMEFALKLRKFNKEEMNKRVERAAEILSLESYLERKPKALSGGQRQRVALGRAIVREPKVFLMDEPLSNLDAKLRVQMRTEITKLHQELKTTFIYVTHDQTEAMTMGTRIVVMKDGVVQQVDTPQNIYAHPNNIFVAGFIGSPQMNFLDARVERDGDKLVFNTGNNKFIVSKEKEEKLMNKGYINKDIVIGIRPEHISNIQSFVEKNLETLFESNVDLVELMGSESYIYMKLEGKNITAKIPGTNKVKYGESDRFALDSEEIYMFDKETTLAI
ncbi:sn-glycerol-3-phosphate ABC transporter ATP-binding protein UgpC [uncultured Clostridium sp.]|uniref:ABC transporter ATP-binding protein n=1 Tax=uncultured Clostridium sp. TaxID=59620 RepID=UPI00260B146E|nr:sn-glycerol-3-phosphate ABC transporter ATP-binding protein UgpC [uncultured Clostridium sp.]